MKILLSLLVVCSISITKAQNTEAHIVYDIKMESSEPEIEAQLAMFSGSTFELFFKDKLSKQILSMGALLTTTTVIDGESEKGLMLTSGMTGKRAAPFELNDLKDLEQEEEGDVDIQFIDEEKEILGYTCKKAIIMDEEGNETTYWYTEELSHATTDGKYINDEIPGMPLSFAVVTPQITMDFTASSVVTKIKKAKSVFSLDIPEGYSEVTLDEFMGGPMGGQ